MYTVQILRFLVVYWQLPITIFSCWFIITFDCLDLITTAKKSKTYSVGYNEGILPKGPYPPCLRMAGRVLLAGYPRYVYVCVCVQVLHHRIKFSSVLSLIPCYIEEYLVTRSRGSAFQIKISTMRKKQNNKKRDICMAMLIHSVMWSLM